MPCVLHKEEARPGKAAGEHMWLEMAHVWSVSEVPDLASQLWPLLKSSGHLCV